MILMNIEVFNIKIKIYINFNSIIKYDNLHIKIKNN